MSLPTASLLTILTFAAPGGAAELTAWGAPEEAAPEAAAPGDGEEELDATISTGPADPEHPPNDEAGATDDVEAGAPDLRAEVEVEASSASEAAPPKAEVEASSASEAAPSKAPAEASSTAAVSPGAEDSEPAPEAEVSPLLPRSQIEFLNDHPIALDQVRFRPGKGLTISSKSERFALTMGLRVQLRYTLENDRDPEVEPPRLTHSFQVRRARLVFSGHMFGEHNKFKAELSFSPKDVGLKDGAARYTILRDFYLEFDYLRDLTVRVGQYKLPYSRQRVISSGKLQLVDRSIIGSEFDFDRDIGLDLRSEDFLGVDRLRYYLGVYFGGGRDNYTLEPLTQGGGLVYIARFEVLPLGSFSDYLEGDFKRTRRPRLALGAAYSFMDDASFLRGTKGSVPLDEGTTNYHNATASLAFRILGLSLSGEFFWRQGQRRPGDGLIEDEMGELVPAPVEAPRNGLGWYAQAGYMIPWTPLELAGRYSQVRALGASDETSMSDRNELGGGLSWYFGGHPFKLQADYFRIWSEGIGEGIDQIRVQAQISF